MNLTASKKDLLFTALFSLIIISVNNSNFIEQVGLVFSLLLAGISALGIAFSFYYLINKKSISKELNSVFKYFLFFAIVVFLMSFYGPSLFLGLQRTFQILSVLGLFYLFYNAGLKGRAFFILGGVRHLIVLILIVNLLIFIAGIKFTSFYEYSSMLLNPNGFGMWISILSLLAVGSRLDKKYLNIALLLISFYLIFASGSRTSLFAFFAGCVILYLPLRVINNVFFKYSLISLLILMSFFVIYFTVYFDLSNFNEVVRNSSGKNLQSGRHLIWPAAMEAVWHNPWFGFGSGTNVSDVSDPRFSAHNAYLQTLVQNGFVGLFIMVSVIIKIYFLIYESKHSKYFRVGLSMFAALLLIQNFENTIFQNNLALSYPVWALIGLLFGHYHYQKKTGSL